MSEWISDEVDMNIPSAARVYDYLLGGGHNFAPDRALAQQLLTVLPARDMARLNRAFLARAIRFLVQQGIDQFLDLGSGIPTVGNVHEVAQAANPNARVVYVDNELVAVSHSTMLLRNNENATAILADMRDPESILRDEEARRLLDLTRPVGLLMVGVVQFVPDADDPWAMAATFRDAMPSGSYLALSSFTADNAPAGMKAAIEVFKNSRDPIFPRTRAEVIRMFGDFDLVEPGLVYTPQWRPDPGGDDAEHEAQRSNLYAGVGRKP